MCDPANVIFGFFLGLIASIIGAIATHTLTEKRDSRNFLRTTFKKYKSSFADGIAATNNDTFGIDTFSRDFDKYERAVDEIRPFLCETDQRNLQKAWDQYCGKNNDLGMNAKEIISADSAMIYTENKELFQEFIKRFNNLHSCLDHLK